MRIFFTILFILAANLLFAQRTIIGTVVDKDKKPLSEVSILAIDTEVKTMTNTYGEYSIQVPEGFNVLLFSKPGMKFQTVEITNDTIHIVMFGLNDVEVTLEELMKKDVEVVSGKKEALNYAPANVMIISSEDIQNRGYTSIADVLVDLPGFDVMVTNGVEYVTAYQRGYRTPFFQRTLFMINGKVDNNIYSQTANVSRQFPMNNIERIEVLYGPASAVYGPNAFLGVINVITKTGADLKMDGTKLDVSTQGGSFNTRAFEMSCRGKKNEFTYAIGARLFNSDESNLSGKWGYLSNDWYSNKNVWGPMLIQENASQKLNHYYDPSRNMSLLANFGFKSLTVGIMKYYVNEAYGPTYPADRVQNNNFWNRDAFTFYIDNDIKLNDRIFSKTSLSYRKSGWGGDWTEATPDWHLGKENYSYISRTSWNAFSDCWLGREDIEYALSKRVKFSGGLKYEQISTSKNYDIPGYWIPTYGSTIYQPTDTGKYGYGIAIGHSTDSIYSSPPSNTNNFNAQNMAYIFNFGGYALSTINISKFEFNLGVRYDKNSIYGETVNPRLAAIYKLGRINAIKLLYGEAFQEPSPIMLWGGWQGREMNSNLKPEKVKNIELMGVFNFKNLINEVSTYYARYNNVIKEDAENGGSRIIFGFEYRLRMQMDNILTNSAPITGYLFYTFTHEQSDTYFNHATKNWETVPAGYKPKSGEDDIRSIGDIAPHKVQLGFNIPIHAFRINVQGNWISSRNLYSRNPMRINNYQLDPYFLVNANVGYFPKKWSLSLRINNVLNANYLLPGVQAADAGNDFSKRSLGFYNSITPSVGRNFMLNLTFKI